MPSEPVPGCSSSSSSSREPAPIAQANLQAPETVPVHLGKKLGNVEISEPRREPAALSVPKVVSNIQITPRTSAPPRDKTPPAPPQADKTDVNALLRKYGASVVATKRTAAPVSRQDPATAGPSTVKDDAAPKAIGRVLITKASRPPAKTAPTRDEGRSTVSPRRSKSPVPSTSNVLPTPGKEKCQYFQIPSGLYSYFLFHSNVSSFLFPINPLMHSILIYPVLFLLKRFFLGFFFL